MRKMFLAPDFASSQRARQSCSGKHSDTFSGVDTIDGRLKVFTGVVSSVEDMGEKAAADKRWRVSIEVAD
jgi:hypothetical protein